MLEIGEDGWLQSMPRVGLFDWRVGQTFELGVRFLLQGLYSGIAVVCCLFGHMLVVLDDFELYESGRPLPLHHVRALVKGLKGPLFKFCWEVGARWRRSTRSGGFVVGCLLEAEDEPDVSCSLRSGGSLESAVWNACQDGRGRFRVMHDAVFLSVGQRRRHGYGCAVLVLVWPSLVELCRRKQNGDGVVLF